MDAGLPLYTICFGVELHECIWDTQSRTSQTRAFIDRDSVNGIVSTIIYVEQNIVAKWKKKNIDNPCSVSIIFEILLNVFLFILFINYKLDAKIMS